jgi:hypothetical protein
MESALGTGTRHEAQRRLCCASGPTLNSRDGTLTLPSPTIMASVAQARKLAAQPTRTYGPRVPAPGSDAGEAGCGRGVSGCERLCANRSTE